ncbi:MAG TPA: DEAD/DEAH box helicase, partial [Bacteroidales bacterium]|nr:DEAD/DEAH box helicase [Bacteroidales bacterium]
KTAAFTIAILQQLTAEKNRKVSAGSPRALIVTPTRELAIQIGESFSTYGKFTNITNTVIFGGVKQGNQTRILQEGVDVLVATPGRLLDLMNQGYVSLRNVGWSVLDEADRMLDMGFIHDVRKIIAKLPPKRQSLFFSATMPPEIVELSKKILGNPARVTIQPEMTTAEKVKQSICFAEKADKPALLTHVLRENHDKATLVFTRTKHGADKITRFLKKAGITSNAIHGNKSQTARQIALENIKKGYTKVLIATDIAARGIDIDDLQLVINYDLPNIAETYVHRIGRTGRAGADGQAISFCDKEERAYLKDIQKLIKQTIPEAKIQYTREITNKESSASQEESRTPRNFREALPSKINHRKKTGKPGKIPDHLQSRLAVKKTENKELNSKGEVIRPRRIIRLKKN